jgi:hypothetical protein
MGSEKWQFLLMVSTIYADVGGMDQKNTKNVLTSLRSAFEASNCTWDVIIYNLWK